MFRISPAQKIVAFGAVLGSLVIAGGSAKATGADQSGQHPPPADAVVSEAVRTAAAAHKIVLIEFGASWCTWCRHFDAFVHAPQTNPIITANYVVVNLVVQESEDKKALENPGGQALMDQWGGAKAGLPFYVFLDTSGKEIADSKVMPDGTNVGFPGTPTEVGVFLGLLDRTAPRMTRADRATIQTYLEASIQR
jgi:thiol:disulfide interchange protein